MPVRGATSYNPETDQWSVFDGQVWRRQQQWGSLWGSFEPGQHARSYAVALAIHNGCVASALLRCYQQRHFRTAHSAMSIEHQFAFTAWRQAWHMACAAHFVDNGVTAAVKRASPERSAP
jgi:hypothetical protein